MTPIVFAGLPRPIWLNVGRVAVEKNIEAFVRSRPARDQGGGGRRTSARGPGRRATHKVRFVGAKFNAELAAHYACADVFVFPFAYRHIWAGDPRSLGRRHAGGRLLRARSHRYYTRHRRRRSRGLGGRRVSEGGVPWRHLSLIVAHVQIGRRAAIPGGPAPRSSCACCNPTPNPKRAASGAACGVLARLRRRPQPPAAFPSIPSQKFDPVYGKRPANFWRYKDTRAAGTGSFVRAGRCRITAIDDDDHDRAGLIEGEGC